MARCSWPIPAAVAATVAAYLDGIKVLAPTAPPLDAALADLIPALAKVGLQENADKRPPLRHRPNPAEDCGYLRRRRRGGGDRRLNEDAPLLPPADTPPPHPGPSYAASV